VYSGVLAEDELHNSVEDGAFNSKARVYPDGFQVSHSLLLPEYVYVLLPLSRFAFCVQILPDDAAEL
jgi:hypothetical protein